MDVEGAKEPHGAGGASGMYEGAEVAAAAMDRSKSE